MKKIVTIIGPLHAIAIILLFALIATPLIANPSNAMAMNACLEIVQLKDGTEITEPCVYRGALATANTTTTSCVSPEVTKAGKQVCPIYLTQAISNALDEQLKGAP